MPAAKKTQRISKKEEEALINKNHIAVELLNIFWHNISLKNTLVITFMTKNASTNVLETVDHVKKI